MLIINKVLNDFSCGVLTTLQQDIQKANCYAIILDETSDKGQISTCFRISMNDLQVQEVFCGVYETTSTTSEELFKVLESVLSRFQLPIDKRRSQSYVGTTDVSGHIYGLRKKLTHEESRDIYVHCRAHILNLIV